MKPILAVDYGQSRVGIAISDELQLIASPYATLPNSEHLIAEIDKIIEQEDIGLVVIGIPYHLDGSKSEQTESILKFITELSSSLSVQVTTYDERYSSIEAKDIINKNRNTRKKLSPKRHKQDKENIDRIAASVFLQHYLNDMER